MKTAKITNGPAEAGVVMLSRRNNKNNEKTPTDIITILNIF